MYRLWISDLAATSVKQLTSCLGNCTSLGTTKHESRGLEPHGKVKGIGFWLSQGWKSYSPSLLPSLCPGALRNLAWCCVVEVDVGFILYVCPCEKNVFGKQILKCLVCSFCFICRSQRGNCIYAYLAFWSCRRLMTPQPGCVEPRCT